MNKLSESIFKRRKPNCEKLRAYGFEKTSAGYFYTAEIMRGQFVLKISVRDNDVDTETIDSATDDPYTLFLTDGASGSFVGAVRAEYESVLQDIAEKCFDKCVFQSAYAQKIIEYVRDTYGDALEFLWEKFSDNAVWRRKDNGKWYGVMLTVAKNKLGLPFEEKTEILDVRARPETIEAIVDNRTVFGGYHMNKRHWLTVCLDGSVPLREIEKMIDISYGLAKRS